MEKKEQIEKFMKELDTSDKTDALLTYVLMLINEITELNKKLDKITHQETGAIKVLVLR